MSGVTVATGIEYRSGNYRVRIHRGNTVYTRTIKADLSISHEENIAIAAEVRNMLMRAIHTGKNPATAEARDVWPEAYVEIFKQAKKRKPGQYTLTKQDELELVRAAGGVCALTGIRFINKPDGWSHNAYGPSLDRIDSSKGYTPDNVRLVCVAANLAMNEWGEDILRELAYGYLVNHTEAFGLNLRKFAQPSDSPRQ